MKRRDTLKSLLVGGLAGASISSVGCKIENIEVPPPESDEKYYGRTPKEVERDAQLMEEVFFSEEELTSIAILCDIILPATGSAGSATDAEVPAFIEFISKDLPDNQLPLRGGLMWLDIESNRRYNKVFRELADAEQISIIDDIAYPDPDGNSPEMEPGRKFFKRMRNLTLTGYYTTKMGLDDLGYVGNRPNAWDGVPQDVLDKHGMSYDEDLLPKYVDQSKRHITAEWDEQGNLIT